jgi:hypothetical protein
MRHGNHGVEIPVDNSVRLLEEHVIPAFTDNDEIYLLFLQNCRQPLEAGRTIFARNSCVDHTAANNFRENRRVALGAACAHPGCQAVAKRNNHGRLSQSRNPGLTTTSREKHEETKHGDGGYYFHSYSPTALLAGLTDGTHVFDTHAARIENRMQIMVGLCFLSLF